MQRKTVELVPGLSVSGLLQLFWRMVILVYHYFAVSGAGPLTCTAVELEWQLSYLKRYAQVIPLLEALRALEAGKSLPSRSVAITIDDCDTSFYEIGWPLFKQYQVPVLCSVITGCLGRRINIGSDIEVVTRSQLEELVTSGLATLASHSATHANFSESSAEAIDRELASSRQLVESLQGHCDIFTYPYGSTAVVTPQVEQCLMRLGYAYALTTCSGPVSQGTDRFRVGRTNIVSSLRPWQFSQYCNGVLSRLIQVKKMLQHQRFYCRLSPAGRIGVVPRASAAKERTRVSSPSSLKANPVCEGFTSAQPRARHTVSVIIPCYNNASCVSRAITSALEQTAPPSEVIVVNDGSTDQSQAVIEGFGNRVVCLRQDNCGPAAARNRGMQQAKGELVAFLDADDYWSPEFLARCTAFLQAHPETVAVSTGLCFWRLSGKREIGPALLHSAPVGEAFVIEDFFDFWAKQDHIRTGSCMIRREALVKAGYQRVDLRLAEDLELWALLATYGRWGFIPEVLWCCNSETVAAQGGWLQKCHLRRSMCPTVELWQERVVRRLKPEQWPDFKEVRGRVATIFAHNHIVAGHLGSAREIVASYGAEMPPVWSACLLRVGNRLGKLGWLVACLAIRGREYQKAWTMHWRAGTLSRTGTAKVAPLRCQQG